MKMRFLPACIAVLLCLAASATVARASVAECPAYIPAGVVIRVLPDEKLTAGSSSGPTFFSVSSDLSFFPNRPPLLARGSKVVGTIAESKEAGRIYGKARLRITLTSILTSDLCEYPIVAKIIEAGPDKVEDEVVFGRGHAHRDLVALLFPPTTIYQVLRTPSRGPKLVLNNETPLNIKLLEPVSLADRPSRLSQNDQFGALRARMDQIEHDLSVMKTMLAQQAPQQQRPQEPRFQDQRSPNFVSEACAVSKFGSAFPVVRSTSTILRPVRNLTPYHVSIYVDRRPVLIMPPCFGPSMIATPATEFRLEAIATLPTAGGQKQLALKVVPSPDDKGWDIVTNDGGRTASATN
jgi:hypothetical protein